MVAPLLETKLRPPPLRPGLITRPGVKNRAESGLLGGGQFLRRLTLICATAGYGKTTVARTWLDDWGSRLSWLSLDEGDDDPYRFWRYLVAALSRSEPTVGTDMVHLFESLGSVSGRMSGQEAIRGAISDLINHLIDIDTPLVLALDDYHHVSDPRIHEDMRFLLENLPPTVHVVVITRTDPPWPLSRWRVRGEMVDIRRQDLRWTPRETQVFLSSFDPGISVEDAATLARRSEGWPAALQMAGISLENHPDRREFLSTFAGTNRYLLDYLGEEVLEHLPDHVRDFLFDTAALDALCAPLCDAVTGRDDGREMLATLERHNLFLIPLDDGGEWYRYHRLFADIVRHMARTLGGADPRQTNLVASRWHLREGHPVEAVEAALSADAPDLAEEVLAEHAEILWKTAGPEGFLRWFGELSPDRILRRPLLGVYFAFACLVGGRFPEAIPAIEGVERHLAKGHDAMPGEERRRLEGISRVLRSFIASFSGDHEALLRHADGILEYFPERTPWRFSAAALAGDLAALEGDPLGAEAAYRLAMEDAEAVTDPFGSLFIAQRLGFDYWRSGRLSELERFCRGQIEAAHHRGFGRVGRISALWALRGNVLRERGEFARAEDCFREARDVAGVERTASAWVETQALKLYLSTGDVEELESTLSILQEHSTAPGMPAVIASDCTAGWALYHLMRGDTPRARALLSERDLCTDSPADLWRIEEHISLARVKAALDDLEAAMSILESLRTRISRLHWEGTHLAVAAPQMVFAHRSGRTEDAMELLAGVLPLAETEGFSRVFLDEGAKMRDLLGIAARRMTSGYIATLLERFDDGGPDTAAEEHLPGMPMEALSERELEILSLLAEGLSNRQVGQRLYISSNTVKWHTGNIYGKLGASNRTEAVRLARDLNLLEDV